MKIEIVDGEPTVAFRKSEETALKEALRICKELSEWLTDDAAGDCIGDLEMVIRRYLTPKEESSESAVSGG